MMTTNRTLELITTSSSGNFTKDLLITAANGVEAISQPFEHILTVQCKDDNVDIEKLLGTAMAVKVSNGKSIKPRFYHGLVSHIAASGWEGRHASYQITLKPWLWLLQKTADCRIFQQMSVPEVITSIFDENGFSNYKLKLSGNYKPRNYCVQYRETDFNFISRLLENEGIYYHFTQEEKKHTLVLSDAPGSHSKISGCEKVPFYPPGSTIREDQHLENWAYEMSVKSGSYALNDFDFTKPKAGLEVNQSIRKKHDHSSFEVYDYPGSYNERAGGTNYAAIRIEQIHSQASVSSGAGNVAGFYAGGLFTLDNHPQKACNKEYLITAYRYQATINEYESGSSSEATFNSQIDCVESQLQFRPAENTHQPIISGPQTGIIVGPSGEEIWTDEYGRVKVQFHWDRYGKSDENSSCWIRVSQLWAGANWGGMHIPRIGQEVIVEFLEGNPDMPIITGRTYNADNMPPYALPENQTQSGIKSRSSKGGSGQNYNEICFEDLKGSELITLHAEKDQLIEVENDENHTVGHDRSVSVTNDETIDVGNNRSESVGNDESISIGNNRNESVAKNESITIGESRTEDVGKDETISIGSNRKTTIGKDETLVIDAKRGTKISKDDVLDVGKKLTIQAGDEITLKTGSAQIVMKKNGDITIKGKNINLKGSGNITIKGSKVQSN